MANCAFRFRLNTTEKHRNMTALILKILYRTDRILCGRRYPILENSGKNATKVARHSSSPRKVFHQEELDNL